MNKVFVPILLFLFTIFNISCSKVQPDIPKIDKYQVINKLRNSTVALISENDGTLYPTCTAVWINEETILTAYHCADSFAEEQAESKLTSDDQLLLFLLGGSAYDVVGASVPYAVEKDISTIGYEPEQTYQTKVVAVDEDHDLALLKAVGEIPTHDWIHISEYEPSVGDNVYVEGHQGMLYFTTMPGTISAIRYRFPHISGSDVRNVGPVIQVFSGIWKGNSGGPVVSETGELVGIVSFIFAAPNQGFATASPAIKNFVIKTWIDEHQP